MASDRGTAAIYRNTDQGENVRRGILALTMVTAFLLSVAFAPTAQATLVYQSSFGGPGSGGGQFGSLGQGPDGVAVNNTTGTVYVADPSQNRVEAFTANGTFLFTWGEEVDQTSPGNVCTAASGHTCRAGTASGAPGGFRRPQGVGVDQTTGDVYVQDAGNNRVDKFTEDGIFLLTWGKGVDATSGGNICTAASGHVCKGGSISGSAATTPKTPTANGAFAGWESASGPGLAVDDSGFVYVTDPNAVAATGRQSRIEKFNPDGTFDSMISAETEQFLKRGLAFPSGGIAVDHDGNIYVLDENTLKQFGPANFTEDGLTTRFDHFYGPNAFFEVFHGMRQVAVDPSTGFIFAGTDLETKCPENTPAGTYHFEEFHPNTQRVDCTVPHSPDVEAHDLESGMAISTSHKLYFADKQADSIRIYETPVPTSPGVGEESAGEITSRAVRVGAAISANLADTTYRVEYGTEPCSSSSCESTPASESVGAALAPAGVSRVLEGLEPDTTYHYRVVATNSVGSTPGTEHVFATFPNPTVDNGCANNLARQQTRSTSLLDCRAYELVSAGDTGGYNVESDLVPGGEPFESFPEADGRALYAVHDGGIPGTGKPTNRGPDPYLATRGANGWTTKYVGVPADVPSTNPFQSTVAGAGGTLETFAFGGPDICEPCFGDGSAGIPLRTADGALVQGMAGSMPVADPVSSGEIRKPMSADGEHLVFGSFQQFEPAGNASGTDLTLYERDLANETTEVVSTMPDSSTLENGGGLAELDISSDGSRVLIGEQVGSPDSAGNKYFNLYMHIVGDPGSVEVVKSPHGVLYDGMTSDGSIVYFTTNDELTTTSDQDTDTSADIYRADVDSGSATLTRVSTGSGAGNTDACEPPGGWNSLGGGNNCDVVAIAGGGGVAAEDGSIYFFSPEKLDTGGPVEPEQNEVNLYVSKPGSLPRFVATVDSSAAKPPPQGPVFAVAQKNLITGLSRPESLAVDQNSGDIYVAEAESGKLSRWKADGQPADFASLGTNRIGGQSFGFSEGQVAVDSSNSPFEGDFYTTTNGGLVHVYADNGEELGQLTGFGEACGVAVDQSNGDVYVGSYGSAVRRFRPISDAKPVTNASYQAETGIESPNGLCNLDASSDGHVYTWPYGGGQIEQFESSSLSLPPFPAPAGKQFAEGANVQSDSQNGDVYVDERTGITRYDSADNVIEKFGQGLLSESHGIGVNGDTKHVYATTAGGNVVDFAYAAPPYEPIDNPTVLNGLHHSARHRYGDFQVTPDGRYATFASLLPVTGFQSDNHYNVFRYDTENGDMNCVSCNTTLATPTGDASLASDGLSLTDDGRVFFTTTEPLVLEDNNEQKDAYEWENGTVALISTGKDSFPSGIFGVSSDGKDAYFFTRETLAPGDENGTLMKLYDARALGGFFAIPPAPPCAASDECHGPGSAAAPPVSLGTLEGTGGNTETAPPTKCRKGFVKKHGKCVKQRQPKHHSKRHGSHRNG